jgi:putative transposase
VPHAVSCRALGLSQSWFYKWRVRPPTPRQQRRAELAERIREPFAASGGTYGSPRITLDLWAAGYRVSENTVARLMAQLGLAGRRPRRRPRHLTKQGKRPAAPDLVRRKFTAVAPNVLWCGDLTEIDTDEGKLYLATVLTSSAAACSATPCPSTTTHLWHGRRCRWPWPTAVTSTA